MRKFTNLFFILVKTSALVVMFYASAALAIQINLGGDVEYWLSMFIALGVLIYSLIEWKQK